MAFTWALCTHNKLRTTWISGASVLSASTEAVGYPKENVADGNIESEWRGSDMTDTVVIDSGDASLDIDYICVRFRYGYVPTTLRVQTSADDVVYADIDNNADGSVSTTTTAACSPYSRVISVTDESNINVGNTIMIDDGVLTATKYLVVEVGSGYIVIDRYPLSFADSADVTVVPDCVTLLSVSAGESERYVKLTVSHSDLTHILEVQAFAVLYTFDGDGLPLNPFPVTQRVSTGSVMRSFNGTLIGKMRAGPYRSVYTLGMGKVSESARQVIYEVLRLDRFGIIMDNAEYIECMVVNDITMQRRASSDSSLISYAVQVDIAEC